MRNTHTSTFFNQKYILPVLNQFSVELEILHNPYQLPLHDLFQMAARINKKRSFLFVSKLLGKHIPIDPKRGLLAAALLANRYIEVVKGTETRKRLELLDCYSNEQADFSDEPFIDDTVNPVIIGFAETATALGHAFFQAFEQADFFHTTREQLLNKESLISFEEEHSHATSHRSYIDASMLHNDREVILVDDEMTTGKTAINIIRSIQSRFPRKTYTVVSILDWRSEEHKRLFAKLEEELGIQINEVSLLSGVIELNGTVDLEKQERTELPETNIEQHISVMTINESLSSKLTTLAYPSITMEGEINQTPYLQATGRFGLSAQENGEINQDLQEIAGYLQKQRSGSNTLCLGTGEFMYIPMKLAAQMGAGVRYHSTTRSPIYPVNKEHYGAKFGLTFPNPEDWGIDHFVYNIPPNQFDELFLFFEREVPRESLEPLLIELKKTQIKEIKIVFLNGGLSDE